MVATKTRTLPPPREGRIAPAINAKYETEAKERLRKAIRDQDASYDALADWLTKMGVEITARGLENKISRGSFSAGFLLMCYDALGIPEGPAPER